jgi:hypothetical protein
VTRRERLIAAVNHALDCQARLDNALDAKVEILDRHKDTLKPERLQAELDDIAARRARYDQDREKLQEKLRSLR